MCKTISINPDLTWVGALDPNLRIFDIIMETKFGTTYNSYVLKGTEGVAIFETVKEKFFDEHLEKIKSVVKPEDITYIVVNHTEPDHAGSVGKLLEFAPNATVVGSSLAIRYMSQIMNKPFKSKVVKDGETISLGNKTIKFLSVPQLHWPDTMYSYVIEDETLITCDSFGAHYSDERVIKSQLEAEKEADYIEAYNYYFSMIMGPFKPYVLKALDKIKDLSIKFICPGHGMVLDGDNIEKYMELYREWSQPVKRETPSIVIPYVSAYGYTAELAEKVKEGIESLEENVDVLMYDLVYADINEVIAEINKSEDISLEYVENFIPSDKEGGHYRTEFRLNAWKDSTGKSYKYGDSTVDIILSSSGEIQRIYMDGATLEQCENMIRYASSLLDSTATEADIQEAVDYIDEHKEANGYYYGKLGLLVLGHGDSSYEFMLKYGL